jgi:hypothetical protein
MTTSNPTWYGFPSAKLEPIVVEKYFSHHMEPIT